MTRINRNNTKSLSLPSIGEIKVGEKTNNSARSFDYFVASCKSKPHEQLFNRYYGDKPQTINILFPEEADKSIVHKYTLSKSNQSKHEIYVKGDGHEFEVWVTKNGKGEYVKKHRPKDGPAFVYGVEDEWMEGIKVWVNTQYNVNLEWQEELTLYFYVVGVKVKGYFRFITHASKSTIPQILDELDDIQNRFGTITMFPYDMVVKKVKSNKPGVVNQFPVVSINANVSAEAQDKIQRFLGSGGSFDQIGKGMIISESDILQIGEGDASKQIQTI